MSSPSSSLRPLPGRRGSSRRNRQHEEQRHSAMPPSPRREATSSSSSYNSKRLDLVKAVQSSLKQLYAAGYTRARATCALVAAIELRMPVPPLPRSDPPPASIRSAPPPVTGMPSPLLLHPSPRDDDVLSAMRRHRIGDGSARHVLVVAQWVERRTQELLLLPHRSTSRRGAPDRAAAAMARAVDELTQLVRDAPRSILARRAQPGASASRHLTPSKVVPVVRAPSAADSPLLPRSPSPPSTTQERPPRAPPTQNNKKPKAESASPPPPRARSDSAVDAERTISSKLRSAPAVAASASAASASSSEAGANPGVGSNSSSTRKRLRSGTVVNKSNSVAVVESIHSRSNGSSNSSIDAEGSGDGSTGGSTSSKSVPTQLPPNASGGKRTRTRR